MPAWRLNRFQRSEQVRFNYIDTAIRRTRWLLQASLNGETWTVLVDKGAVDTDLSHDLVV